MKLQIRHAFDCSVDQFWQMYWDPEFDARLRSRSGVTREVLEERREGQVVIRRVKLTPDADLPAAVAALTGSRKLVYEQENRWDEQARILHWKVIPSLLPGKLDAAGTMTVRPTAGGCEQIVDGSISVRVMLVGSKIEKGVVDEVTKSYEKAAAASRQWLEEKGISS